jgi:hypothetical protein
MESTRHFRTALYCIALSRKERLNQHRDKDTHNHYAHDGLKCRQPGLQRVEAELREEEYCEMRANPEF